MSTNPYLLAFVQAKQGGRWSMLCATTREAQRRQAQLLAFRRRYRKERKHVSRFISIDDFVVTRTNELVRIIPRTAYRQEKKHD